jgi:hypothetical protein
VVLCREPGGHHRPAGGAHCILPRRVGEQLVERPRKRVCVPGRDAEPAYTIFEPILSPTGGARDDRPSSGEGLDSDKAEWLGPNRWHDDHRRFCQLVREVLGAEPTREADALLYSKPTSEPTHRIQLPAISAYNELSVHVASRADQDANALCRRDPTCEHDTSPGCVPGTRTWNHRGKQWNHHAPSHTIRG